MPDWMRRVTLRTPRVPASPSPLSTAAMSPASAAVAASWSFLVISGSAAVTPGTKKGGWVYSSLGYLVP
jgi:hypothetical protein